MGGPDYVTREAETDCAMRVAGCEWEQWHYPDDNPDWIRVARHIRKVTVDSTLIIAPAWEDGGHEQHNAVAEAVLDARPERVTVSYLTYKRGHGRSTEGTEVVPTVFEAEQKRIALDCYRSQIAYEPTSSWFGADQREHVR